MFSVDVFADDEYCGGEIYLLEGDNYLEANDNLNKRIQEQCEVGDLLWIVFNASELLNEKALTDYQGLYCNFEHEISVIKHSNGIRHLQCILTKQRTNRPIKE
jgi:hypothetical protein